MSSATLATWNAIMQIARRHNLAVIEDCSQAHLSEYNGRLVGTIGDIACFFLASKQSKYISCAGGGITITNNDDYGIRGKLFMDKRWIALWRSNQRMSSSHRTIG